MVRKHLAQAIAVALLGAACAAPAASPPPAAPTNQETAPQQGGVINLREASSIDDRDPTTAIKGHVGIIGAFSYNSLLGFKTGPDVKWEDLVLRPELAERWEVSPDAKRFTYHLRQGVHFANLPPVNGRELTSADVKFSLEYGARIGEFKDLNIGIPQYDFQLEGLEAVETPDRYTVTVRFKEGFVPFLNYSASDEMPILPREIYDADGHFHNRAAGTGAWQLDLAASQTGTRFVWKKNPDYWDAGKPYIDEVRYLIVPDDPAADAAFQAKQLDVYNTNSPVSAETIRRGAPQRVEQLVNLPVPHRLYMTVQKPPMNDMRVRKAISLALDRDEFVRTLAGGNGLWGVAGAFPDTFTPEEARQFLKYDPAQAQQLLKDTGYGSHPLAFEMPYEIEYGQLYASTMQLVQAQLKKVGIDVTLKPSERTLVSARRRSGDFTMAGGPVATLQPDIDGYLFAENWPKSGANYNKVDDAKVNELLQAQRREVDPARRREILRQVIRYINEQVLGLATYFGPSWYFSQPYVKNYHANSGHKGRVQPDTWLAKSGG